MPEKQIPGEGESKKEVTKEEVEIQVRETRELIDDLILSIASGEHRMKEAQSIIDDMLDFLRDSLEANEDVEAIKNTINAMNQTVDGYSSIIAEERQNLLSLQNSLERLLDLKAKLEELTE